MPHAVKHTPVSFFPDVEVRADEEAGTIQWPSEEPRLIAAVRTNMADRNLELIVQADPRLRPRLKLRAVT